MEVLEFTDSSAIAKIQFDYEENQVGVAYTYKPDKVYVFKCNDLTLVKEQVKVAESVGKLISQFRKDGTLISV
ncbi:MAG: hypothetical protein EBU90_29870 [Proteobacteria bacterium]|nr:hypothetical protein [Pseudomonadota bacterium]